MHSTTLLLLAALASPSTAASGVTLAVPVDFPTIQSAIVAAGDGATILVAPGVYPENIDYLGRNATIQSTDGAAVTTIDGRGLDTVVTFQNGENSGAQLIGFTITNGHGPDGSSPARGGGIHCAPATSPTIRLCVITGNLGSAGAPFEGAGGGGVHSRLSSPSLVACRVEGNFGGAAASVAGSDGAAGGIHSRGSSGPTGTPAPLIQDCTIRGNLGGSGGDAGSLEGGTGGIMLYSSPALVIGCLIEDNTGGSCGSGSAADHGGAGGVHIQSSAFDRCAEIVNCIIRNNLGGTDGPGSGDGGSGGVTINSDAFPLISNCLIYGNVGGDSGTTPGDRGAAGGVGCLGSNGEDPVIVNCTIVGNTGGVVGMVGGGSGGIVSEVSSQLQVLNSIIWGNTASGENPDNIGSWAGTAPRVRRSVVGGGYPGNGNLNVDPLFVTLGNGDLHLTPDSPCIDAGILFNNAAVAPVDDLDGKQRSSPFLDIGAYEYGPSQNNYCVGAPNSYSAGATAGAFGSTSILRNEFAVRADNVPNTSGLFFYGPNQIQVTFGDGFRCVGGAVKRLPPNAASSHTLIRRLNFPNTVILSGSTWNFQGWFRDLAAGGVGFNTSDAISVTFTP